MKTLHRSIVASRTREFQAYLKRLDYAARRKIEAAEAAYLERTLPRGNQLERLHLEQMQGFEELPAGRRYRQPFLDGNGMDLTQS